MGHPPSLATTLAVGGACLGVIAAGSMVPRLAMWGPIVNDAPGAKGLALGFDDGPHPVHTRKVMEILAEHGVSATFFVIGEKVVKHVEVIRELGAAGHEVGVHGFKIDRMLGFRGKKAVTEDLKRARDVIGDLLGTPPLLFRPPYGVTNPTIAKVCTELELTLAGWNVRAYDGVARTTAADVERRVIAGARDGAIVCMHDAPEVGERVPVVIEALPRILATLKERGLSAKPVGDLLDESTAALTALRASRHAGWTMARWPDVLQRQTLCVLRKRHVPLPARHASSRDDRGDVAGNEHHQGSLGAVLDLHAGGVYAVRVYADVHQECGRDGAVGGRVCDRVDEVGVTPSGGAANFSVRPPWKPSPPAPLTQPRIRHNPRPNFHPILKGRGTS
jgi:peptidoglycan/xylan/chitin deacetylase (PgdA/CDA1 family)